MGIELQLRRLARAAWRAPRLTGGLQAAARRGPALGLPGRDALPARVRRLPSSRARSAGLHPADGDPRRAARRRARSSSTSSRTSRPLLRFREEHVDELRRIAALRRRGQQRRPQGRPLPSRGGTAGSGASTTGYVQVVPKLRTVIWDFCGQELPSPAAPAALRGVHRPGSIAAALRRPRRAAARRTRSRPSSLASSGSARWASSRSWTRTATSRAASGSPRTEDRSAALVVRPADSLDRLGVAVRDPLTGRTVARAGPPMLDRRLVPSIAADRQIWSSSLRAASSRVT